MKGWIIIMEPSPFRWRETYIMGPYRWFWIAVVAAWWRLVTLHVFGLAKFAPAACRVEQGDSVLWDGRLK